MTKLQAKLDEIRNLTKEECDCTMCSMYCDLDIKLASAYAKDVALLLAIIEKQRKALEFYAHEAQGPIEDQLYADYPLGRKARQTIAETEEMV